MSTELIGWLGFGVLVLLLLALDLGVFHKKSHEVGLKESLVWTAVWIGIAVVFGAVLWWWRGGTAAQEYYTAYVIEKSLSIDNLFVFLVIFDYFKVAGKDQHKILFWGILGALVMRILFIGAGVALLTAFHWVIYVFGVFLIFTGIKLGFQKENAEIHPDKNPVVKLVRRLMPLTTDNPEGQFFVKRDGRRMATSFFIVLVFIETTDVLFAVDSIPAVLAISQDIFVVYTSNVFAILGLRALYFALAGIMRLFRYLKYGLVVVLVSVGVKMLVSDWFHVPSWAALSFIAVVLGTSIAISILKPAEAEDE